MKNPLTLYGFKKKLTIKFFRNNHFFLKKNQITNNFVNIRTISIDNMY